MNEFNIFFLSISSASYELEKKFVSVLNSSNNGISISVNNSNNNNNNNCLRIRTKKNLRNRNFWIPCKCKYFILWKIILPRARIIFRILNLFFSFAALVLFKCQKCLLFYQSFRIINSSIQYVYLFCLLDFF